MDLLEGYIKYSTIEAISRWLILIHEIVGTIIEAGLIVRLKCIYIDTSTGFTAYMAQYLHIDQ